MLVRNDDTVTSYYDPDGLSWSRTTILNEIRKNSQFMDIIKEYVLNELQTVNTFLKNPALQKRDLLDFFTFFKKSLPMVSRYVGNYRS